MPYSRSFPLDRWHGERRNAIDTLATAHANLGEVEGPGRPLETGRPLAHAYLLRVVAEFQAFTRDLHDLAAEKMVEASGAQADYSPVLVAAATEGRFIDRGNADLRSLQNDFRRLGMHGLSKRITARNGHWLQGRGRRGDQAYFQDLIEMRNALAHGNQGQVEALRVRGVMDTVTWPRGRLPGLDRIAQALDRIVWDHVHETFGVEPW